MSDRLKDFALQIADEQLVAMRAEIARLRGDAEVARLRLEAAQGEIERLRSPSLIRDSAAQIERLLAEIARLRLTDEEREAVDFAADFLDGRRVAETLRKMLERLHK